VTGIPDVLVQVKTRHAAPVNIRRGDEFSEHLELRHAGRNHDVGRAIAGKGVADLFGAILRRASPQLCFCFADEHLHG
jgi:hypothetical protein